MSNDQTPSQEIIWLSDLSADEARAATEILDGLEVGGDLVCRGAEWARREIGSLVSQAQEQHLWQMQGAKLAGR